MDTFARWLTGVTVVAVVATAVASPYTAPILGAVFGGIANVYKGAKS